MSRVGELTRDLGLRPRSVHRGRRQELGMSRKTGTVDRRKARDASGRPRDGRCRRRRCRRGGRSWSPPARPPQMIRDSEASRSAVSPGSCSAWRKDTMWDAADGSLSGRNGRHPSSVTRSMRYVARRRACWSIRSNPSDESIAIDDSSPMADAYDIVESSKRRASLARRRVSGSKLNGSGFLSSR